MTPVAPRIALATCREVADLDPEGVLLLESLRGRGVDAVPAVWDDDRVDWAEHHLVVVRSTWDYAARHDDFLAWARHVASVTALVNPVCLVEWSSDKHYLGDLASAGLHVVPSHFIEPSAVVEVGAGTLDHPHLGVEHVVKPTVSAGSRDALRLGPEETDRSRAHVRSLLDSGRSVLVQPYLRAVDEVGETALVFVEGELSHALRKEALLRRGAGLVEGLFAVEEMSLRTPSPAEVEVGRAAVALATERAGRVPLYARVDLIPDDAGVPCVLELELVEPSLFLTHAPDAAAHLADGVLRLLGA